MASTVSIVIPAYNEAAVIGEVVHALHSAYPQFEIIVVNDGSTDATAEVLATAPCRVITHSPNRGYGASWKSGCRAAAGDIVIFYDGDDQFDVADVGRLLELHHASGAQMTSGARQSGSHTPVLRMPGKAILKLVARHLSKTDIPDLNCGLRAFDRKLLRGYLSILPDGFSASTTSMLAFLKRRYKVSFLPIVTKAREGKSSVKIMRDGVAALMLIIRMITLFDPLGVFLPVATVFMGLGFVYSAYEAMTEGLGVPVFGATLFLTGILMFFLGILCDQISATRLHLIERDLERE